MIKSKEEYYISLLNNREKEIETLKQNMEEQDLVVQESKIKCDYYKEELVSTQNQLDLMENKMYSIKPGIIRYAQLEATVNQLTTQIQDYAQAADQLQLSQSKEEEKTQLINELELMRQKVADYSEKEKELLENSEKLQYDLILEREKIVEYLEREKEYLGKY
ncbi:hypothetical protein KUTeg_007240 [Tegillarca granosa]|uniref:Uncharacterized protein n=1 Tax=Tegillarca granosa TaxID=220873 RepID=A0ABQ9FHB9_TEGGR|nr:hypothetical protein KUTeg_007240 [Tegillarca granosa]